MQIPAKSALSWCADEGLCFVYREKYFFFNSSIINDLIKNGWNINNEVIIEFPDFIQSKFSKDNMLFPHRNILIKSKVIREVNGKSQLFLKVKLRSHNQRKKGKWKTLLIFLFFL
jgi:hypothetical protein